MSSTAEKPAVTFVEACEPRVSRWGRIGNLIFGRPLAAAEDREHKLGALVGVPALGLDALCSSAYGPEAALTLLLPLGAAGIRYIVPLTGVIVAIALVVYLSYRQTIAAYPSGGGSYTVAKENLSPRLGIIAAAALACDYVLNVAVGISAGVGALVSAVPALLPHTLALCLGVLALLVLVNLRGTREAGLAFVLPTCLFVGTLLALIVLGGVKAVAAGGHPAPVLAPPTPPAPVATASLWLVLRAFASGCTALTGIEAVSNGVTAFREPRVPNAQRTLGLIVGLLALLLAGIALLCRAYRVGATVPDRAGYQSVISELAGAVVGRGPFYYVTMGSVLVLLCLSANTSFAGFPRLCSLLARDRFLPDVFAAQGRRLVFSWGVVTLALVAALLLVAFGGVTDRLIPLFAIGALLAFTLSQAGMVVHWRKLRGPRRSLALNLVGALATGATTLVVAVSKFADGAWVALVTLGVAALTFSGIRRHYESAESELVEARPLAPEPPAEPVVIVPLEGWNKLATRSLAFARRLSDEIHALHVVTDDGAIARFAAAWEELVAKPARAAGASVPELVLRHSRYRQIFGPILEYVEEMRCRHPDRDIVVIVPGLVPRRWYQALLHNERGALLKALLRARAGERVVLVNMPYHLTR